MDHLSLCSPFPLNPPPFPPPLQLVTLYCVTFSYSWRSIYRAHPDIRVELGWSASPTATSPQHVDPPG